MNLLTELWLPVERASGRLDWIAPHQITETDDPPQRLAAVRPDFNGSLMQFLIGLVQTTTNVDSNGAWERAFDAPPSPEQLKAQFASVASAFEFDGEGARFMQDLTLSGDQGEEKPVSALLIEAPGAQSIERNVDHFVKRGEVERICPVCAAAALFTLHTNAPSGGAGHRTSLRGGGPLTTLVIHTASESGNVVEPALWRDVWLNVRPRRQWLNDSGEPSLTEPCRTFPWLASVDALQPGEETQPVHAHPAQMFWAMPRRIRLDFTTLAIGTCDLCGRISEQLLTQYHTKNYGMNYKGSWRHPLSPYYRLKPGEPALPLHPQPGGLGYRHWLAWVLGSSDGKKNVEPAAVVSRFLGDIHENGQYRLWAFGFDMDNMKARCWYESTLPLYTLPHTDDPHAHAQRQSKLQSGVGQMVAAAELTVYFARSGIRSAWFGDVESKGDISFIDAAFWSGTESAFYRGLQQWMQLVQADAESTDAEVRIKTEWLAELRNTAKALFGDHAESGQIGAGNPQRIAAAFRQLIGNLHGPKLLGTLGLQPAETPKGKTVRKKSLEPKT